MTPCSGDIKLLLLGIKSNTSLTKLIIVSIRQLIEAMLNFFYFQNFLNNYAWQQRRMLARLNNWRFLRLFWSVWDLALDKRRRRRRRNYRKKKKKLGHLSDSCSRYLQKNDANFGNCTLGMVVASWSVLTRARTPNQIHNGIRI